MTKAEKTHFSHSARRYGFFNGEKATLNRKFRRSFGSVRYDFSSTPHKQLPFGLSTKDQVVTKINYSSKFSF